ncbi:MAG: phosphatidylserine decarboxylase family protein [Bacteroidetes bacterium]|nr:MAG: phosphatidylserine decarboxylase family protein [Bacteroidota bacterium]MBL1144176.1 phosphatidylserine decarboxylase family protein [Bacteroidota bacterium]MCB0803550.1 phosphatidylserine decarboxylase family protein [Flavobacteriales bacterium]NOG56972.1 phosphatidylserine decarboxylase family protein [Bacteroidota bacterium]
MKFHKEGYPSLALVVAFGIVLNLLTCYFLSDYPIIVYLGYAVSAFLLIVILQFFRSPKKNFVINENQIISPCDGKVVVIEEVLETEYLNEKRRQISIFMSPINVHNNLYPIGGILKYFKYHPGKYLVAWHPKSSTENERTTAVVEDSKGRSVLFRQIAGALARRIVFYGKEGEAVKQTQECGFIKFGSRVDLFLPLDAKIIVNLEQKVTGGETVIAEFA